MGYFDLKQNIATKRSETGISNNTGYFALKNKMSGSIETNRKIREQLAQEEKKKKLQLMSENAAKNLEEFQKQQEFGIEKGAGLWSNIKRNVAAFGNTIASIAGKNVSTPELVSETPEYTQYRKEQEQAIQKKAQEFKEHPLANTVTELFGSGLKIPVTDMAEIHYFKKNVDELSSKITDLNNILIQEQDPTKKEKIGLQLQDLMTQRKGFTDNPPEIYKKTKKQIGAGVSMGGLDLIFLGLGSSLFKTAAKPVSKIVGKDILNKALGENFGKEIFGLSAKELASESLKNTAMTSMKEMLKKEATQNVIKLVGNRGTAEAVGAGASYGIADSIYRGNTDKKSIVMAGAQGAALGFLFDRTLTGLIKGTGIVSTKLSEKLNKNKIIKDAKDEVESQLGRGLTDEEQLLLVDDLDNKIDIATKGRELDVNAAKSDLESYIFRNQATPKGKPVDWKNIENLDIKPNEPIKLYRQGSYETNRPTSWSKSSKNLENPIERTFKPNEIIVDTTDKRFHEIFKDEEVSLESLKKYNDLEGEVIVKPKVETPKIEKPETKPAETPKQKVPQKPAKAASDINTRLAKSGFKQLTTEELAGYTPITKEKSIRKVAETMEDYDKSIRMALGREKIPNDVERQVLFNAVVNRAIREGDHELLEALARSPIATERSLLAQKLGSAGYNIDKTSTIANIQDVVKTRTENVTKKMGKVKVDKELKQVRTELEKKVKKAMPTKEDWNKFISDIQC